MKTASVFSTPVRLVRNEWIPLSDGSRLAARMWLPESADRQPVPAILEYIPYRKSDGTAPGDAVMHAYFAGDGYASLRVDIRGSGDSDGVLTDEYTTQEHRDCLDVLRWLAEQPWCDGRVGMIGISWGGFNSLQIAALRPPELKAIISVCSTDDRYANDEHYMGGCLQASEIGQWANELLALRGLPPDPTVVGARWREMWFQRLEALDPTLPRWISHQRRDEYWKHGSVCEDYSAIQCAVYMVGGWEDGYRDAILRVLRDYPGPRKGLIGPWGHIYPHEGAPGPAIGFLQHALRWWDHWLKGIDTGMMGEPMLTAWMQEPVRPERQTLPREGRWVTEACWPSPRSETRKLALSPHGVGLECGSAGEALLDSPPEVGIDSGCWISWVRPSDFAGDQRADDGRSMAFTSEPVKDRFEVFGSCALVLRLSCDSPNALLAVRLCDVFPDGASTQITRGALNLTHRDSHEAPTPMDRARTQEITIPLQATAYRLEQGHRLRVSISSSLWPLLWPSPRRATIRLHVDGSSWLELPVRGPDDAEESVSFAAAEGAAPPEHELLEPPLSRRVVHKNVDDGRITMTWDQNMRGSRRYAEDGLEFREGGRETYVIVEGEPLSAEVTSEWHTLVGRGEWQTRVEAVSRVAGDEDSFYVSSHVQAFEGEALVFSRSWDDRIPRDLV